MWVFLLVGIVLFFIGIALVVFTMKKLEKGLLRKFLLTAGASLIGIPIFAILHNLFYGLFIYLFGADFWVRTGIEEEPFFFILATMVCPLGFLAGAIGSIVLGVKRSVAKHA